MIPIELKKAWLDSSSHKKIAEHMIVKDNLFRIENINIKMLSSDKTGVHIQFLIDEELECINILESKLIEKDENGYLIGVFCNLFVLNVRDHLEVVITSLDGRIENKYKCYCLSMGPANKEKIVI